MNKIARQLWKVFIFLMAADILSVITVYIFLDTQYVDVGFIDYGFALLVAYWFTDIREVAKSNEQE